LACSHPLSSGQRRLCGRAAGLQGALARFFSIRKSGHSRRFIMVQSDIPTDETQQLIASNKVEGTAVYNREGEKLGSIYNFMVDKRSGEVEYAVLSFGGLFGMGGDYYPLPWEVLDYDTDRGGYAIDLDKSVLEKAPHYSREAEPPYDRGYGQQVYGYYGLEYPH
jgi:sporulation protein YlmC with PRC-barrel domain